MAPLAENLGTPVRNLEAEMEDAVSPSEALDATDEPQNASDINPDEDDEGPNFDDMDVAALRCHWRMKGHTDGFVGTEHDFGYALDGWEEVDIKDGKKRFELHDRDEPCMLWNGLHTGRTRRGNIASGRRSWRVRGTGTKP